MNDQCNFSEYYSLSTKQICLLIEYCHNDKITPLSWLITTKQLSVYKLILVLYLMSINFKLVNLTVTLVYDIPLASLMVAFLAVTHASCKLHIKLYDTVLYYIIFITL